MNEIKCKFYKTNQYVFVVDSKVDEKSVNIIEEKYKKTSKLKYNPIYKKEDSDVYFLTCICADLKSALVPHTLYKFKIEIRQFENKYANIFILGKLIKVDKQMYKVL